LRKLGKSTVRYSGAVGLEGNLRKAEGVGEENESHPPDGRYLSKLNHVISA
jgi:hypothetical protein